MDSRTPSPYGRSRRRAFRRCRPVRAGKEAAPHVSQDAGASAAGSTGSEQAEVVAAANTLRGLAATCQEDGRNGEAR